MAQTCTSACYNDTLKVVTALLSNQNYSSLINPNTGYSSPVIVKVIFVLIKLLELTNSGTITIAASLTLSWTDSLLKWNPLSANLVTVVKIPSGSIWTPELTMFNGVSANFDIPLSNLTATVTYEGTVIVSVPREFKATCPMDLTYFPFDSQKCTLRFVNPDFKMSSTSYMTFSASPNVWESATELYTPSGEFTFNNVSITTGVQMAAVQTVQMPAFNITLSFARNPDYYLTNVAAPSVLLLVSSSLIFFIPSDNSVKIAMACSLMVALYVLQQAVARILPATKQTPLLAMGMMIELWLGGFSLICAVLTVTLRTVQPPLSACCVKVLKAVECITCVAPARAKNNQIAPHNPIAVAALKTETEAKATLRVTEALGEKADPLATAVMLLLQAHGSHLERQERAELERQEAAEHVRNWRIMDFLLNAVLFIIYITMSIVACSKLLFGL